MEYFFLISGLVLLFLGGEFLVRSAVSIALKFNISKLVVGMTVVSLATSAPELLVSLESALDNHSDISFGNVIGSNIANIGLVLGLTCLVMPIPVSSETLKINYPVMSLVSILLVAVLYIFQGVNLYVGIFFLLFLGGFLYFLVYNSKKNNSPEDSSEEFRIDSNWKSVLFLVLGGAGLYYGADLFINGAVDIATDWGVSDRIISLSVVAIGTSVPELAASLIAAFKKQDGIALGNLLGSNIFNILAVLGVTSLFTNLQVIDMDLIFKDVWWMLGFAFVLYPLIKIGQKNMLNKKDGVLILLAYIAYIYLM
jgi:cation:H+ antiporter